MRRRIKSYEGQATFGFMDAPQPPLRESPYKKPPAKVMRVDEWRKKLDLSPDKADSIDDEVQRRFNRFHAENPNIYAKLVELARQVKATGKRKYSIWALFNRVRWHIQIETKSEEPFKISNDFTSRYSRLIMQQEPDLKEFFTLRPLGPKRGRREGAA